MQCCNTAWMPSVDCMKKVKRFGTSDLSKDQSVWPLLAFFAGSALTSSTISAQMWAGSAPRPSYGRGLGIVLTAVASTSLLVVLTRVYWSRQFLVLTSVLWAFGAIAHRALRRRRPWTERMVVATREKELLENLRDSPHADVVSVLDPGHEGDPRPGSPGPHTVSQSLSYHWLTCFWELPPRV